MLWTKYFLLGTVLILSTSTFAQVETLITDRPDLTESPFAVARGDIQVETGWSSTGDVFPGLDVRDMTFNSTLVRIGLFDQTEIRLTNGYSNTSRIYTDSLTFSEEGFQPFSVGVKSELTPGNGLLPAVGFLYSINFPLNGRDGFLESFSRFDLIFNQDISDVAYVGYMLGVDWEEFPTFNWTFVIGRSLGEKWGIFGELYGSRNFQKQFHSFDGGLTYLVNDHFQLDASGGLAMSRQAPDWYASAGFSYLFRGLWGQEDKL